MLVQPPADATDIAALGTDLEKSSMRRGSEYRKLCQCRDAEENGVVRSQRSLLDG